MPEARVKRRLTAILAADVVGYSRMMGQDETGTLTRLKDVYRELVRPRITRAQGRVVKLMGDGLLAEFPSVVEAVRCAVDIQEAIAARAPDPADGPGIQLRIGINLGDVIVEGADIYGDGVNVAARLESLATPGCVCISESVRSAIGNKLPISYAFMGEQSVKNIAEPIRVYEVRPAGSAMPATDRRPRADDPAIAVLPFDNMSGGPGQEYFSDGITEDIITALSHFRAFPVIARNSTFAYKGQAVRVQQIASELGARYVLEGSVRKAGERVRITAQLIDAETGHHVWAGRFDSTLDDIFDVQDEITSKIVATIQPELTRAEFRKAAVKRPENLTAWDLVLRGMAFAGKHTSRDHGRAREAFQAAIEFDPDYAEAWAGLAWSYLANITLIGTGERQEFLHKGLDAAARAVELDNRSSFAHYVLGVAYTWSEELQKGISEAETALQLNPYHAQAHMGLGNRLDLAGRTLEGIRKMEHGLQLSPRDPFCFMIMAYLSRAHLSLEQPAEALDWIEQAVSLQPGNADLRYRHAICLAHLDRVREARRELEECEQLQPGFLSTRAGWKPYSDEERNRRFFAGLQKHGLMPEPPSE